MSSRVVWVLVLAGLAPAAIAVAQQPPLAEVARREADRRKGVQPGSKTLTNKDLPKVANPGRGATPTPTPTTPPPATADTPATAATPNKPETAPQKDEAWWRARIGGAREALRRGEVFAEALQSRINALATDFVGRDDPAQRARIGEDRQKALAELARVREEITALTQAIEDIEEEARKAGVAPGWLR